MGDRVLTVRVDEVKLDELRRLFPNADDAALIQRAVDECLEQRSQREPGKSSLLSIIGMFQGEKDMSARHDEFGLGADPA